MKRQARAVLRRPSARTRLKFNATNRRQRQIESLESRQLLAVVVSELMASNQSTLADENGDFSDWIELHNTGPVDVDLDGWYLSDSETNPTKWQLPQVSLAVDEHLVIFASEKDRRGPPGVPLHTNFKLSAEGEYLGLSRPDGATVEYSFAPQFPPQSADVSYGLSADGDAQGYFAVPTPGMPNGQPRSDVGGTVVISEIMYSLPRESILTAEDVSLEFIELHNRGDDAVDVTDWQFVRGVTFTFPNASIPAGGTLVVAADLVAFQAAYPTVTNVVGGWVGTLSNRGETLEIVDSGGGQVESLRYADEGDWSTRTAEEFTARYSGWVWESGHDGGGKSLELINLNHANDNGQNWAESVAVGGTPGRVNSVAASNIAPLISGVRHSPALPRATDSVVVTASISDETPSVLVSLDYRVAGDQPFATLTMSDDGQQGDAIAGDGVYSVTLPAQPDRTVIEFYVRAIDTDQQARTWPAPTATGAQDANALYQVIDEFDANAVQPGAPLHYHVIMTPDDRETFDNMPRTLDAQYNTTFVAVTGTDIDIRYNTGVRYRGSGSRQDPVPNNRINLPHDNSWQGITAINVNQRNPVSQIAGSALFRLANVPAAGAHAVRLFSNGVDYKNGGVYIHSEVLDSEYAENHFVTDSEGNLYRGRRPNESPPGGGGAGLTYFGPDPAPYVSYLKSTNASSADWSDVIDLTFVLNQTSDENFVEEVRRVVDVDQWFRVLAMNSLISNDEFGLFTGDRAGDDYAMYRGINDRRFQMVPYDWDTLFTDANESIFQATRVPALDRLIRHPEFLPEYYDAFQDLIDDVIRTDEINTVIDQALQGTTGSNQIETIKSFLQTRADNVEQQIGAPLTVESAMDRRDDVFRTESSDFSLFGNFPLAGTHAIRVNGQLANIDDNVWSFSSDAPILGDNLVELGADWRYLDDGSNQGIAWRATDFDDSTWATGPGQLGYGDGDERTVIGFGDNPDDRFVTSYFRTTFELSEANASQIHGLLVDIEYDDGTAVYLNGTEVLRVNLDDNADANTLANESRGQTAEVRLETFNLPSAAVDALVVGTNVLAVEMHQADVTSPDVSFDMRLTTLLESEPTSALKVGMNRVPVATYDNPEGLGAPSEQTTVDIWYDNGAETLVTTNMDTSTTWDVANSPYRVQRDVRIAAGVTLTIEPGVTVFFDDNASLVVSGQFSAVGTEDNPIWFTRRPGESDWDGLQFRGTTGDNRIEHAIVQYGITTNGMVGLEDSAITITNSVFDHTDRRRIRSIDSSLVLRDSVMENIFDFGEAPTTDNASEHIWGRGIPEGGQWILQGNTFGTITGHNDAVDFDSAKGVGRYAQILDNHFLGGGDDALDVTGDVYVEGNVFTNYIKDQFNTDPGESNTISASDGDFWVIRNVFDNVQHASLVKEEAFMHFLNNSVISSEFAALYFDLPGQTSGPGRGADVSGSLFANTPRAFDQILPSTELSVNFSFLPEFDRQQIVGLFNQFGDPHVGGAEQDYQLLTGSLAANQGPNAVDMGARIAPGATIAGTPQSITNAQSAVFTIGGPGVTEYRYQLDNGPISDPIPVATPVRVNGLSLGSHQLKAWGRDALGRWQTEPTTSDGWIVVPTLASTIRINEIQVNRGEAADRIELYNTGVQPLDFGGYSLSDRLDDPTRYVIPAGTIVPGGGFLTLDASSTPITGPEAPPRLNLGFGLNRNGDRLLLFTPSGTRLDGIEFGIQAHSQSLGRIGDNQTLDDWALTVPSFGQANVQAPLGDASALKINEWYASGSLRLDDDHIELFNAQDVAVSIGDLALTDEPFAIPRMSPIPRLSFVDARGFVSFVADGRPERGFDHTAFRLSANHEHLALTDHAGEMIDQVFYYPQTANVSQGRSPDGASSYQFQVLPSMGAENASLSTGRTVVVRFGWDAEWKFDASGQDLGTAWREFDFDDANWESGPGLLGNEREALPETLRTEFELGDTTYYFRRTVEIGEEVNLAELDIDFSTIVDDGFIVYINGTEVLRQGMPNNVDFQTLANRNVNEAELEGPFSTSRDVWRTGANVIAVEVHQTRLNSTDLVFGLALEGSVPIVDTSTMTRELVFNSLRMTEVMYNPSDLPGLDGGPTESAEYIELQNTSEVDLDISGVRIAGGVNFVFPEGSILPADSYTVVTSNATTLRQTYGPGISVAGEFAGRLNNGGETLVLQMPAPLDTAILRFDYSPNWFEGTNGQGSSLTIGDPSIADRLWGEAESWLAAPPSPGRGTGDAVPADLNGDNRVSAADIDYLCSNIEQQQPSADLDQNGQVDQDDMTHYLQNQLNTTYGNVNLDGIFNSSDFVAVFAAGEYEDLLEDNSSWSSGDWNCDGDFTTRDLVFAFSFGGYRP